MICPVRMCQPIPASPSKRRDRALKESTPRNPKKIKSPTEGTIRFAQAGSEFSFAELFFVELSFAKLYLIAIGLNLIE